MIENVNDFLSVAFLALLLIVAAFQVVKHFSSRHARRIMDLERDYYIQDFEEDEWESDRKIRLKRQTYRR